MTTDKKELVTTIAYLIGVKKSATEQCYGEENGDILENLYNNKDATIIRYLCKLRTALMQKFRKTDDEMRFNLKNLNKLEWFDADNIKQLEKWGIPIIKTNYRSEKYMQDFNRLISENIDKVSDLFPDWINWNYIKDLFVIPHYTKTSVATEEFNKYMGHIEFYPFQVYIHWKPYDCGSMLYNDGKFLSIVYKQHNDYFSDYTKYKDAHDETKNSIYDFIEDSYKAEIVVDCENSDVYKLCSVLRGLKPEYLAKIEKIVLYDDSHTNSGWDWLEKFTHIPVEHLEVKRVTDQKSLVDIKMTAGVCKDYYENEITSFILLSSDSDFWGLISSLDSADFLVMYENQKCGHAIKEALSEHGIRYCSIDDFCSSTIEDFKRAVLFENLEKYIPDIAYINGKELLEHIYTEARINASEQEKENFYNKYIKTLRLKCDDEGNFKVVIAK